MSGAGLQQARGHIASFFSPLRPDDPVAAAVRDRGAESGASPAPASSDNEEAELQSAAATEVLAREIEAEVAEAEQELLASDVDSDGDLRDFIDDASSTDDTDDDPDFVLDARSPLGSPADSLSTPMAGRKRCAPEPVVSAAESPRPPERRLVAPRSIVQNAQHRPDASFAFHINKPAVQMLLNHMINGIEHVEPRAGAAVDFDGLAADVRHRVRSSFVASQAPKQLDISAPTMPRASSIEADWRRYARDRWCKEMMRICFDFCCQLKHLDNCANRAIDEDARDVTRSAIDHYADEAAKLFQQQVRDRMMNGNQSDEDM
jgi:hypothetical protein